MPWPLSQDYNEAIQNPATAFGDGELRGGQAATNALGLPMPRSGNFADVYEFTGLSGAKWALKCFTREVPGLQERYRQISLHLQKAKLPFTVDFQYLPQGIRVRGQWYPILKMNWVEGFLLNEFVRQSLDKPKNLEGLSVIWARMSRWLRDAGMAHADLQHGNVILVPGSKSTSLAVKLIDYDGMFVPTLAGKPSGEVGHPAFQHPQRAQKTIYSAEVDRLPLLAVACALRGIVVAGKQLWLKYDNGDNVLFTAKDLANPSQSPVLRELWNLPDETLHDLTGYLAVSLAGPLEHTPLLHELMQDNRVRPMPAAVEQAAQALLGPGATIRRAPPPAARPSPTAIQAGPPATNPWEDIDAPAIETVPLKRVRPRSKAPLLVGAGVLGFALIVGVVVALSGGGNGSKDGIVQKGPDKGDKAKDGKDKEGKDKDQVGKDKVGKDSKDKNGKKVDTVPVTKLAERLAGTRWINTNKATFEWDAGGKFLHGGKPMDYKVLDDHRLEIAFGPKHVDTLVFDDRLTRFEQYSTFDPARRPLFTGQRQDQAPVSDADKALAGKLVGRFKLSIKEQPKRKSHWTFTKEGRAIQDGNDMGGWKVLEGKAVITYVNKQFGTAELSFQDDDTLVGRNRHTTGQVFNWVLRREPSAVELPGGPSPLDKLDPANIAPKDRDAKIPELVAVLSGGHTKEVFGVTFSPNERLLASVGNDGNACLWDLTGKAPKLRGVIPAGGSLSGLAFSPDSERLAFATPNRTQIFDVTGPEPKRLFDLKVNATRHPGVAWSPDGKTLAVTDNEGAALLDMTKSPPEERPRARGHKRSVRTVAFSKDGTKMLTASEDATCRVWDMTSSPPTELAVLTPDSSAWQAAFSPDAKSVAAGTNNTTVYCWDIGGPKPEVRWFKKAHNQWCNSVSFAADGKSLVSTEGGGSGAGVHLAIWWNAANGEILKSWELPERASQCAFAPSGRYLAITCHNYKLYVLRLGEP